MDHGDLYDEHGYTHDVSPSIGRPVNYMHAAADAGFSSHVPMYVHQAQIHHACIVVSIDQLLAPYGSAIQD
jgi:hypothetical protein